MKPAKNGWVPLPAKAMAFDVDPRSLAVLQELLVDWQIDALYGATVGSLPCNWNPEAVDLQIVGVRANAAETLALCQFLSRCSQGAAARRTAPHQFTPRSPQPRAPALLVLLSRLQYDGRIGAAFAAEGYCCLPLPIEASAVATIVAQATEALTTSGAQTDRMAQHGRWDDDGGQVLVE